MESKSVRIIEGGKLIIPAAFRRDLGMNVGDTVIVENVGGELRIRSRRSAIANAQRLMRQLVPEGTSVVDEFIAERRAEAERE
ncbi:hypothetical protein GCM10011390_49680 [Aureimonas endophytica]|uniref:SpoVT-AbrB domain-containing protein n=1 Tax=Aureimonas endophytica TaxID=2027858 RepID=A0A917A490_9HYPH|nr:AbrB/MazE/SpoVT family DNA-binding domain-containing protein [Aureimonas endophytica]GGE24331.1 hypothetical protein GCM10011390_49680 [Aureimonas endophytica]